MNLVSLLFSFEGRINRAKYWLALLIYIVVAIVAIFGVYAIAGANALTAPDEEFGLGLLLVLALLVVPSLISGLAVSIKRLHDRDKSGWWILVFYVLPMLLEEAAGLLDSDAATGAILFSSFVISIWALVELGFLRGTQGPNRYGPDPLG